MNPLSLFLLLALLSANSFGISIGFKNNTDNDIIVHTAQYGGTPQLHEKSSLTKIVEIKKQSSAQIFLYETGSWLRWEAKSKDGEQLQTGTIHLNEMANKHHIVEISGTEKILD